MDPPRIDATPRPMFLADWDDVVFVHYALDPAILQPHVPFTLDCFDGAAYVSLVAFTQRRLRPRLGGRLAAVLSSPLASHPFLNVRTYVTHRGQAGIYFMSEWIPNRLATMLGPPLYGLPYRLGRLRYRYARNAGIARHDVTAGLGIGFDATFDPGVAPQVVLPGSRDAFLLERYLAFTRCRGRNMCFRVGHVPWPQQPAIVTVRESGLLDQTGVQISTMQPVSANYSRGVKDVWLSAPIFLPVRDAAGRHRAWTKM
jgi:uncharacterized protein YqjF (DUF2071 family)